MVYFCESYPTCVSSKLCEFIVFLTWSWLLRKGDTTRVLLCCQHIEDYDDSNENDYDDNTMKKWMNANREWRRDPKSALPIKLKTWFTKMIWQSLSLPKSQSACHQDHHPHHHHDQRQADQNNLEITKNKNGGNLEVGEPLRIDQVLLLLLIVIVGPKQPIRCYQFVADLRALSQVALEWS